MVFRLPRPPLRSGGIRLGSDAQVTSEAIGSANRIASATPLGWLGGFRPLRSPRSRGRPAWVVHSPSKIWPRQPNLPTPRGGGCLHPSPLHGSAGKGLQVASLNPSALRGLDTHTTGVMFHQPWSCRTTSRAGIGRHRSAGRDAIVSPTELLLAQGRDVPSALLNQEGYGLRLPILQPPFGGQVGAMHRSRSAQRRSDWQGWH